MKNLRPRKVNEFFWDCKLISEWTGIHSNARVTLYHSFLNTLLNLLVRSFILLRLFWLWASQVKLVVRNSPVNAEDTREAGSIPESGRSPGGGHGNPLQYSCQENPVDRGVWRSQRVGHNWSNLGRTHRGMHMLVRVTISFNIPKPSLQNH